jgi:F-type H+-transporting ATPase subunit delta
MSNPRLAARYAKSLLDLAVEQNQLEAIHQDIRMLQSICSTNQDFINMLRSPIIAPDKKLIILEAVTAGKVQPLTQAFFQLLVKKAREYNLPEMVKAFIDQYNQLNHIHPVRLTTAIPLGDTVKEAILTQLRSAASIEKIELETVVDESIIGGFTLEVAGKKVDASIQHDLLEVKKQFMNNDYMQKIR